MSHVQNLQQQSANQSVGQNCLTSVTTCDRWSPVSPVSPVLSLEEQEDDEDVAVAGPTLSVVTERQQ